jgi:hypothetical protein
MFRSMKWSLPLVAVVAMLAFSASTARAEDTKGSVTGTVVDKDGKPAAGVHVRLFHPFEKGQRGNSDAAHEKNAEKTAEKAEKQNAETGEKPEGGEKPEKPAKGEKPMRDKPVATATTDSNGAFTMKDVPAGKYVVLAMLKGQGGDRKDVEVTGGNEAKVELKLVYKDKPGKDEKKEEKKAAKADEKLERKLARKAA